LKIIEDLIFGKIFNEGQLHFFRFDNISSRGSLLGDGILDKAFLSTVFTVGNTE